MYYLSVPYFGFVVGLSSLVPFSMNQY